MLGLMTKHEHRRKMNQLHLLYGDEVDIRQREFVDLILKLSPERLKNLQRDLRQARNTK